MKDISEIRADFPILNREIYGKPLVYFDNGATTQKPNCVIDAVDEVYESYNSNIHRGVHLLSDMSSEAYEKSREKVMSFINAGKREEIVFTSGTTGSINGIAFSFGERYIKPGDEIILSHLEHHLPGYNVGMMFQVTQDNLISGFNISLTEGESNSVY